MQSKLLTTFSTFLLCIFLSGCGSRPTGASKANESAQKVTTFKAQESQVEDFVELVGRTKALESVNIQSRVSGFLTKIHFQDGQQVAQGDLLFSIEADQYQAISNQALAQVKVAESQRDLAQKTLIRSDELIKTSAISQQEYEQNQAAVAQAQASVIAAEADAAKVELDLNYTQIFAPFSGRVDRTLLDEGNFVNGGLIGGTLLTTLVSTGQIQAVANVDESLQLTVMRKRREKAGADFQKNGNIKDLKIPCDLQLPDETGFPHKGFLDYLGVQINRQTGTSQIRGLFENEDGLLKPGMFVRLKIPTSNAYAAVLVPDKAIGTDQATKFVYVVNANQEIEQRSVITGDRRGKMRIIKDGLEADEHVVVSGIQLVRPGVKVESIPLPE